YPPEAKFPGSRLPLRLPEFKWRWNDFAEFIFSQGASLAPGEGQDSCRAPRLPGSAGASPSREMSGCQETVADFARNRQNSGRANAFGTPGIISRATQGLQSLGLRRSVAGSNGVRRAGDRTGWYPRNCASALVS